MSEAMRIEVYGHAAYLTCEECESDAAYNIVWENGDCGEQVLCREHAAGKVFQIILSAKPKTEIVVGRYE